MIAKNNFRLPIILIIISLSLISFGVPSYLHALSFRIKPIVLTGDSSPEGTIFTQIGGSVFAALSMNNPGAIGFLASTSTSGGIYLATEGTVTRIIQPGDTVIVPELILSGELVRKESTTDGGILYEFSDGHRFICRQTGEVSFGERLEMNDSGDVVLWGLLHSPPVLFSGATLTDLFGCPGVLHLFMDTTGSDFIQVLNTVVSNTGTIAVSTHPLIFLISGGIPTLLPLAGTLSPRGRTILDAVVLAINDSGDLLVRFADEVAPGGSLFPHGLFLVSGGVKSSHCHTRRSDARW